MKFSLRLLAILLASLASLAVVAVVVVARSAAGPGGGDQDDVLRLSYSDDPDTINPLTSNDTYSEAFQREVYESFADRDFADPDKWIPRLATHWEFDPKTLTYTLHLRHGVYWHPMQLPGGKWLPKTEFTSRDVTFTFDCIFNKHIEAAALRSNYEDAESKDPAHPYKIDVTAVDKYTVKIHWRKPYFEAKAWTLQAAVIPRHVFSVDANGEPLSFDYSLKEFADGFNNHWANTRMCGTGPLMFKEWQRGRRLVLVRNPDYWGPAYHFRRLVYHFLPNQNTMMQEALQNDLDFSSIAAADQFLEARHNANVLAGRVVLADYDYPGYRYVGYNFNREIFKDRRFRWALSYAVPVRKIIDEVWKGLARPISGPFLPGSSASDDTIPPVPFDLDKARQLLDEAGWTSVNRDGVRQRQLNGSTVAARFELMIYSDAPQYKTVAEVIKENCRKIGVQVDIVPTKWALMLQRLNKREFDACMLGWALSWDSDPYQIWHGSQADQPDSSNCIAYRNPVLDKLIDELRVTMDERRQTELYHKIHRVIYDDQPYTFLFQDKGLAAYDARLKNVHFYKIRPCVNSREWTVESRR